MTANLKLYLQGPIFRDLVNGRSNTNFQFTSKMTQREVK